MKTLLEKLKGVDVLVSSSLGGAAVEMQPIAGEVPVVQLTIDGRQELPIYVTSSDAQILCLCYLWTDAEVKPERQLELMQTMLELNPAVPLSSFGRVGEHYVLFGALSRDARAEDIAEDVAVLSDNAIDALEAMADYLV